MFMQQMSLRCKAKSLDYEIKVTVTYILFLGQMSGHTDS